MLSGRRGEGGGGGGGGQHGSGCGLPRSGLLNLPGSIL